MGARLYGEAGDKSLQFDWDTARIDRAIPALDTIIVYRRNPIPGEWCHYSRAKVDQGLENCRAYRRENKGEPHRYEWLYEKLDRLFPVLLDQAKAEAASTKKTQAELSEKRRAEAEAEAASVAPPPPPPPLRRPVPPPVSTTNERLLGAVSGTVAVFRSVLSALVANGGVTTDDLDAAEDIERKSGRGRKGVLEAIREARAAVK